MRWMGVSIKEEPPEEPEIPIIPEIPVVPEDTEEEKKEEIYEFSVSGLSVTPSTVFIKTICGNNIISSIYDIIVSTGCNRSIVDAVC